MKNNKSTIILAIAVIVLIAAYFSFNKTTFFSKKADDSTQEKKTINIIKIDKELTEMKINTEGSEFVLSSKDKNWKISKPENFEADIEKINAISSGMADLNADKLASEDTKDLASFGLDKPTTITVKDSSGTSYTIEVGNETTLKTGYYIRKKDEAKIYVVTSEVGKIFKVAKNDLRNKKIFSETADSIETFSLKKGETETYSLKKKDKKWSSVSPSEKTVKVDVFDPILSSVTTTSVQEFESGTDLAKYGLDNPEYTVTIGTKDGQKSLLLGKEKLKDASRYAMIAGKNEVFVIGMENMKFIDNKLADITEN